MKKNSRIRTLISILAIIAISACGGGGGGGGGAGGGGTPTQRSTAILKLATSGTGAIYGVDVTVNLPAGVTFKNTANPPQTDDGVLTLSGAASSGSIATAVYTAATGTQPGNVRILAVNANGFTTGEYCTVIGDIAAGHAPTASDFGLVNFSALDANGNVISGFTGGLSADIH